MVVAEQQVAFAFDELLHAFRHVYRVDARGDVADLAVELLEPLGKQCENERMGHRETHDLVLAANWS